MFRGEREGLGSGIFSLLILIARCIFFILTYMFSYCMAYVCVTVDLGLEYKLGAMVDMYQSFHLSETYGDID